MNTTFLTTEEIKQLTGYQITSRQVKWLEANAIPFFLNGLKRPVVVRDVLTARSGLKPVNSDAGEFELGAVK